ncbi:MAG: DUF4252 domain-containing protein [Saprospiraceae bacterium]
MKKVIFGIIGLFLFTTVFSQNSDLNKFFSSLEDSKEYAVVKVNKEMFQLIAAMGGSGDSQEIKDLVKDLNEITILINKDGGETEYSKFQSLVSRTKLTSYMSFKDEGNTVNLYSGGTTSDGKLKGIVLSVRDKNETIFINVDGLVDLAALGKVTKNMNIDIDGLEYLKDIDKKGGKH